MGTNSAPRNLLGRARTAVALLLPVFALVVLLSLAQPAGMVQADPATDADVVELDLASGDAFTPIPPDGNADAVFGAIALDCEAVVRADAQGAPLTTVIAETSCLGGNAAASNADVVGDQTSTATALGCVALVNCVSLAAAVAIGEPGAPGSATASATSNVAGCEASFSLVGDCRSAAGAAAASSDIGVANATASSTISQCGDSLVIPFGADATCLSTAGAEAEAGNCDVGVDALSCTATSTGTSTVSCGDAYCESNAFADSRAEDCSSAASCAAGATGISSVTLCVTQAACTSNATADADVSLCDGFGTVCSATGTVAQNVIDGCANGSTCNATSDTDVDVEACATGATCNANGVVAAAIINNSSPTGNACDTLASCDATATAEADIIACSDDATCVLAAGVFPSGAALLGSPVFPPAGIGSNAAIAWVDDCTDSATCTATASIELLITDCVNEATCTAGADAFAVTADCTDTGTNCHTTATAESEIGEICDADAVADGDCTVAELGTVIEEGCHDGAECNAQSDAFALIDDGPDADGFACQSGADCNATADADAEITECNDEATCNALAAANAIVLDCGDPAGTDSFTSCDRLD